ncbi:MAG: GH25 family lysozyme [Paracoccaceae bacterium]
MTLTFALRPLVLLLVLATLAACGGRSAPEPRTLAGSTMAAPRLVAPRFDDADPVDWPGRAPWHYAVHGIDVSRWQGTVDWSQARRSGVSFAFVKATEGGDVADPLFARNWRATARAGLPRGAYHYYYHCRPAAEQARWFIRNVPREAGALPPVLDIEWTPFSRTCPDRKPGAIVRKEAAEFLSILTRHYGQRPLIYTTVDFYRETELWRLQGYEFWLRSVADHPGEPFDGQRWSFWQYTGTGLVPGVEGKTDINVFAGSAESWAAWLALRRL